MNQYMTRWNQDESDQAPPPFERSLAWGQLGETIRDNCDIATPTMSETACEALRKERRRRITNGVVVGGIAAVVVVGGVALAMRKSKGKKKRSSRKK